MENASRSTALESSSGSAEVGRGVWPLARAHTVVEVHGDKITAFSSSVVVKAWKQDPLILVTTDTTVEGILGGP